MFTKDDVVRTFKVLGIEHKEIVTRGSDTFIVTIPLQEELDYKAYDEATPIYRLLQENNLTLPHGSMYDHVGKHGKDYQNMTVLILMKGM